MPKGLYSELPWKGGQTARNKGKEKHKSIQKLIGNPTQKWSKRKEERGLIRALEPGRRPQPVKPFGKSWVEVEWVL